MLQLKRLAAVPLGNFLDFFAFPIIPPTQRFRVPVVGILRENDTAHLEIIQISEQRDYTGQRGWPNIDQCLCSTVFDVARFVFGYLSSGVEVLIGSTRPHPAQEGRTV